MVWLAVPLALVAAIALFSYGEWTRWLAAREENVHHRAVLTGVESVRLALANMKGGQRGFLLTGDPNYLASYTEAMNRVPGIVVGLRKQLPDDPALPRVAAILPTTMAEFSRPIELRKQGRSAEASQVFLSGALDQRLQEIDSLLRPISDREAKGLAQSTQLLLVARTRAGWLSTVGAATVLLFLLLATTSIYLSTAQREILIENLKRSRSEIETAQEHVAASERLYRYLFENNPQPMWIYDSQTLAFLAVNDSAIRDYGYSRQEFLSMTIRDIRPEEDLPDLMTGLGSNVDEPRRHSGPWRHKIQSGRLIHVMITSKPITFGQRSARFVAVYDVTGQKLAEEARRLAEERLKLAVEAAGIGTFDWDLRRDVLTWSDQCKTMLGVAQTAIVNYDLLKSILHPDDLSSVESEIQHALEPSGLGHFESIYRVFWPDQEIRWISARGEVFFAFREGKRIPDQFLGCVVDITERVNGEARLQGAIQREKEARETAELLNRVGPMMLTELNQEKLVQAITDLATQLTSAQFGCFLLNQSGERPFSNATCALSSPPLANSEATAVKVMTELSSQTLSSGRTIRIDDLITRADFGSDSLHFSLPAGIKPVRSFMSVPVSSRTKEVLGALLFGHQALAVFDERVERIAQGIASQAGVAFDNARLFETVRRERTNVERHATALASTNADLRQFAYSASHDLQEPLRTVAVYSELIQQRLGAKAQGEISDYLNFVLQGARQMKDLITDMSAYMEIVSDFEPRSEQVDANLVLSQVQSALHAAIKEAHASISSGFLPVVNIPRVHLHQLLQNLLGNALKYRGVEKPLIHIWADRQDQWWVFAVRDNGLGISPEYTEQIFGIFKRLHGQAYPGTGMGLAICKRVVERYGGRIWVESNDGAGATFRFTLPAEPVGPVTQ